VTYSVYQHWDPLKLCVVGRSYPPEFYSWIKVPHVRDLFERIAIETEEDFQAIIAKLKEFGVEVVRPTLPDNVFIDNRYLPPPMCPRDYMVMIGDTFYENFTFDIAKSYQNVKDPGWPNCTSWVEFEALPTHIQSECLEQHKFAQYRNFYSSYNHVFDQIQSAGNKVSTHAYNSELLNGAMVSRIGKDLYFNTFFQYTDMSKVKHDMDQMFSNTRNHVIDTRGHADSTYCPVAPGLIISLYDVPTYADTFPGWEVVYLPGQSWDAVKPFLDLKNKNKGKWWIPGFEKDQDVIDTVETWLTHWTGYVEETVFDVNMLIIDPKNVMVFNYNKQVFDALQRHGITPHIVPFRHRYFWDGGIHCVTADLHREGVMQNYFPETTWTS
jgi:hypothetical protein